MYRVVLNWGIFPACIFEHLSTFKGEKSFYGPILGPGVYLFVFPTGKGYQVYYVGRSGEIGERLAAHYKNYTSVNPLFYLPVSVEHYQKDIFSLFSSSSGPNLKQEAGDFTLQERQKVGYQIMHDTYFAFAGVDTTDTTKLSEIESVLQHGLLKHNKLERHGWFGEKLSSLPDKDLLICNKYPTEVVKKMIDPSLPEKISFSGGQIIIS